MSRFFLITGVTLLLGSPLLGQQQIDSRPQPPVFGQSPQPDATNSSRINRVRSQQPAGQLQRVPDQSVPIPPSMEEMQRRGAMRTNPNQAPQMPAREPARAAGQGSTSPVQTQTAPMAHQQAIQPAASTPLGAAQRPANPPRISYAGGQLTVVADNSQLSDILRAVGHTTGARLEGSAPDAERVFGQFGPGTARDVLNSLLTGSRYDYVLLGSLDAPGSVNRIVLSPHAAGAPNGTAVAGVPNQSARPNYNPNPPQQTVEDEENNNTDNGDNSGNSTETEPPPQPEPQAQPENNANQPNGQQQPNQIKTPEQLLQELQRLRQQQQQQQQQPGQQPQQNPQ